MANSRKDNKGRVLHTGESQRKDGTYMYRKTDPLTHLRPCIYANTLQELREKEKALQSNINNQIVPAGKLKKLTVQELVENSIAERTLAPQTRINYLNTLEKHIKPNFGQMKVVVLNTAYIKAFIKKLAKKGYAHTTIKRIHSLLKTSLDMAVENHIIAKNPAKMKFEKLGKSPKKRLILNLEQQDKLISFVKQQETLKKYAPALIVFLKFHNNVHDVLNIHIILHLLSFFQILVYLRNYM